MSCNDVISVSAQLGRQGEFAPGAVEMGSARCNNGKVIMIS